MTDTTATAINTPTVWGSVRERLGKTLACFVWLQVLMHIVYGVSYVGNMNLQIGITVLLLTGNFAEPWGDFNSWMINSPTFLLMVPVFGLESWRAYLVAVYVAVQVFNLSVCWLVSRFDIKYALLFVSAGWGVTVAWWMGYPDIVTISLLVVLYRHITATTAGKKNNTHIVLLMALMAFNHSTIASLSVLILAVLAERKKSALFLLLTGYLVGSFLLTLFLAYINYDGYGRMDALFFPPYEGLVRAPAYMNATFPWVVYSAFFGTLFYVAAQIYRQSFRQNAPLLLAITIALGGAALGQDTTRLLSIFIIPILLYTLDYAQKHPIPDPRLSKGLFAAAIVLPLIIGEHHIWEGEIHQVPPFELKLSILNIIQDIIIGPTTTQ